MGLLKIKDAQGYFCLPNENEKPVSQITTKDINTALELILQQGDVSLGLDEDVVTIKNPAEKIIFTQLRNSFQDVLESRDSIMSEIDDAFESAEKKYIQRNEKQV